MGTHSYKINSQLKEGMKVEAEARGHKIVMDEPKDHGGTDQGMNPVEITLSSLAGCLSITAAFLAKKMKVEINDLSVEVEGDIDDEAMTSPDVDSGFKEVRFNIIIDSDSDEKKIEKLYNSIEKFCPVSDSLKRSIEVKGNYELK